MNTSAGVGFSWRTGRYVVLSHAAAAAPDNFHIPSRSRLGEKRLTAFRGRDAAFGNQALILALRPPVSPRAITAGRFRLRVGVDVGAVAAGFEQREMYRVLAG